jgi:putative spermidine/putrescine transport system ATP-binding protein
MQESESILKLVNITKKYDRLTAVENVSLDIKKGEFVTILGPSGSGKTTILLMIAGFQIPTSGNIYLKGNEITSTSPHKRGIGFVFQSYALFPHLTVFENIAYPLQMRKYSKDEIKKSVRQVLELVKLENMESRYPKQLSGGQQQRIALSRAMVFNPDILLMDEPLGALDKKLREHMQIEVMNLQRKLEFTVIYVTHDQEEGLVMSDRIAVLNLGRLQQIGPSSDLYENPANKFIADFIGDTNFLSGYIIKVAQSSYVVRSENGLVFKAPLRQSVGKDNPISLSIRPEKILLFEKKDLGKKKMDNVFDGYITEVIFAGENIRYNVKIGEENLKIKCQNMDFAQKFSKGEKVKIGWNMESSRTLI